MKKSKYVLKSSEVMIVPVDEEKPWDTDWQVVLRNDEERIIGKATFAGEKARGTVPLFVELTEGYRNKGYGTEVICMMVNWAFLHGNVYEVFAVTEHENDKAVYALEKAGFVLRDDDHGIETYSILKEKTYWTGIYLIVGIVLGLALALILDMPWVGMGIGLIVSLLTGMAMDAKAKKERESILGKKEEKHGRSKGK